MNPLNLTRLFISLLLLCSIQAHSQKISEKFNAIVKGSPFNLNIVEANDGNYLLFGDISYSLDQFVGSLVKVDRSGKVMTDFKLVSTDRPIEMVWVLPDGKILLFGSFNYLNGEPTGSLVMLNSDGVVDETFHNDFNRTISKVAVQSDGRIITSKNHFDTYTSTTERLNADGSVDQSFVAFQTSGLVLRLLTGRNDEIYVQINSTITRLDKNGNVDTPFAVSAPDQYSSIGTFACQSDGKIVATISKLESLSPFTMVHTLKRYLESGEIDNTFSTNSTDAYISSLIIRQNGKICFTGGFREFGDNSGSAFELNTDGTFSRSLVTMDYNGMYGIYEDSKQNVLVTGGFKTANNIGIEHVVRIKPDYDLDFSFKTHIYSGYASVYTVMGTQRSGKVIIGSGYSFGGVQRDSLKLSRLNSDGTIDDTFQSPITKDKSNFTSAHVRQLVVQEDDKIVLAGARLFGGDNSINFARLLPDGDIDNTFKAGTGVSRSDGFYPAIQAMRWWNSRIYLAGMFDRYNGQQCQSFVMLNKDGEMIGPNVNSLPSNSYIQDMEVQSDGKVILMGTFYFDDIGSRKFVRLNTDGSLDPSFDLNVEGNLLDFTIDPNDNIYVCGALSATQSDVIEKFSRDGSPDDTFTGGSRFRENERLNLLLGYFVKALPDNTIAVGGIFNGYDDVASNGFMLLTATRELVPVTNNFDSASYPIYAHWSNNTLYLLGKFSSDNHKSGTSLVKVVFPVKAEVSNYWVTATSPATIDVSWEGRFYGSDEIIVERALTNNGVFESVATLPPDALRYTDSSLNELTGYLFRITGVNEFYTSSSFIGGDTTFIIPAQALQPMEVTESSFIAQWELIPGTDSTWLQVSSDDFTTFLPGYEGLALQTSFR
jgi:uncharacterized delta-60 repeat protein